MKFEKNSQNTEVPKREILVGSETEKPCRWLPIRNPISTKSSAEVTSSSSVSGSIFILLLKKSPLPTSAVLPHIRKRKCPEKKKEEKMNKLLSPFLRLRVAVATLASEGAEEDEFGRRRLFVSRILAPGTNILFFYVPTAVVE